MYEKTIRSKTVFEGEILGVDVLEVEGADGKVHRREIVRRGAVAAVLARRRDGRFVFVRQFRKAMERICLEITAGCADRGEDPERAAVRELKEETGYDPLSICFLGSIYPVCGFCTERIDLFFAEVDEPGETSFDAGEHIETVLLTENEIEEKIFGGEIDDAKTLAAWTLYNARRRCRSG